MVLGKLVSGLLSNPSRFCLAFKYILSFIILSQSVIRRRLEASVSLALSAALSERRFGIIGSAVQLVGRWGKSLERDTRHEILVIDISEQMSYSRWLNLPTLWTVVVFCVIFCVVKI